MRALPDPFAGRTDTAPGAGAADPDRDEIEDRVARIWSRVLGVNEAEIDIHTDFHLLGGDSLSLLTMLAGVCREVLPPPLETEFMARLGQVIAAPTVHTVATIAREVAEPEPVA